MMPTERFLLRAARLLRRVGFLGVMIVALAACGSGGENGEGGGNGAGGEGEGFPEPPGRPESTFTVADGARAAFPGVALHGSARVGPASPHGFAIRLEGTAGGEDGASIVLFAGDEGTPAPGTYVIGPHVRAGDFAARVTLPGHIAPQHAVSGRLTITRRAGEVLEGRFRLDIEDATAGAPATVSGGFVSQADR